MWYIYQQIKQGGPVFLSAGCQLDMVGLYIPEENIKCLERTRIKCRDALKYMHISGFNKVVMFFCEKFVKIMEVQ